ncbi:hypothetical protein FRC04_001156 [Tulasnella sp. 424]|nr:hypothetical protein FRC04_001156 [Tulasnella sp. 424]
MVPFLCESLEKVVIELDVDEETAKAVVEQAAIQTPRLKSLWFDLVGQDRSLENSLAVWFSKSPLLESVALPRCYQTPAIVHALGNLTFLKHLNVNYTWWDEQVADSQYFCSTSATFLALQKLEIDAPVGQLIQLFQAPERFPQLNEAILSCVDLESPGQILKLTESIAQRYPDITSVTLILYRLDTDRNCNLSFQHIRPLLACRDLGVLGIEHNNPLCVSENDLGEMGAAWLRIRELNLCSKPTKWNDNPVSGGVPLRLLPKMAALFPTVQILGIYVDLTDVPTFDHNIIPSVQFQALRVLDVGTSGVPACGPSTVGFFIGALCKSEVQILRGSAPRGGYRGGHSNAEEWDSVQSVVRLLVQSKNRIHEHLGTEDVISEQTVLFPSNNRHTSKRPLPTIQAHTSELDPMERVLSTPELLLAIFSVADDDVLLAAATVCRKWSTLALDCLWRDLKSVYPLLVLVYLSTREDLLHDSDEESLQCPSTTDWERYDAYAARIRSITSDDSKPGGFWDLAELSLYHPRGQFFPPNVRTLSWGCNHKLKLAVLPFISKSTEHLHLQLGGGFKVETAQKLLRCIIQRQPNLKSLSLNTDIWPECIEGSLAQLISNSRQLESVALPRYYQSSRIVEALGHLPQLKRLAVNYELSLDREWPYQKALSFLPGRFPSLKDVEIQGDVPDATSLLSEFQSAAQLQHLTVSCETLEKASHVSGLAATIAQRCPALQTLSFNFSNSPHINLTFSTFRPVLSCRSLTSFRVGFGNAIKMAEHDFREMALAWPNLRVLVVCPDSGSSSRALSWNMFPTIASLFPYLEQFSANFSSTDEVKFSGDILPLGEFRLLKELGVGAKSTVPKDKTALGLLIGAHCRLPISISFNWFEWETRMRSAEDKEKWLEVESIARRAVEVKQEIRRRWHFRENDGSGKAFLDIAEEELDTFCLALHQAAFKQTEPSTMEFAVQTPELLLAVFSNVERKHLTAVARVCQKWSTLALDFIWRDLDSVVPLVELIVPLKCADGLLRPWELSDLQTECSWNRYDAYADRVRTIQFDDTSDLRAGRNQAITPKLLRKVASLHPRGAFFPRHLRALKWWASVQESALAMVPFLCGSLEEVLINFDVDGETAKAVIEQAAMQTPRLKSLCLDAASPETPLENSLAVWISKSPLLESIALPRYYQTPTIVHALGNLTFLKHLNINYYTWWDERVADYQYFCSTSVAFLALQKLEIDAPVDQLAQLFQVSERFPQLNEAILSSADLESPGQILKLTESLAQQCPDIALIALIFYRHDTDRSCDISFQHIRPLLGCRNLGVLEIGHTRPFRMNENDLEEMGAAWLGIRELNLCSKPARWNHKPVPGGVPLRLLPVMAAVFPMVQILGIYVDSKDVPTFDHNIIPSVQFQALRVLDVGASGAPACTPLTAGFFIGALLSSAIQTPELLLEIFSNAQRQDLTIIARVCQTWSASALDCLWRDLDSVVPLVELVVSLKRTENYEWSWEPLDLPSEVRWDRYDEYADRVRTVQFADGSGIREQRNGVITAELINSLSSLHPRGAFCPPKLRKITWISEGYDSAFAMVPFLCGTLEELDLRLYLETETTRTLIEKAAGQTPNLKSLRIELSLPAKELDNALASWFSKLPLLHSVTLPRYYQTSAIVRALGTLTDLRQLNVGYKAKQELSADGQCFSFTPGMFTKLEKLEIDAPLDQLTQLFQTSQRFTQLNEVILSSIDLESPGQIFNLSVTIAQRCPDITAVTLNFYRPSTDQDWNISFQDIQPLVACHCLKVFEIMHNSPISVNENDLRVMASAWSRIEVLNLCSKPPRRNSKPVAGGLPLRLLPVIASLFPTLRVLGIYIDMEAVVQFDGKILPEREFQSLRVLDVGTSGIPNIGQVPLGFFIGALCKSDVQIVCGRPLRGFQRGNFQYALQWSSVREIKRMVVRSKNGVREDWVPRATQHTEPQGKVDRIFLVDL